MDICDRQRLECGKGQPICSRCMCTASGTFRCWHAPGKGHLAAVRMGSTASCAHHPFDTAEAIIISLLGGIDVCKSHVPGSHDLKVSRRWPHVEVKHPSLAELCKTLRILHAVHKACQHRHALLMPGGQLHSAAGPQAPTCCYQPQVLASCTHRSLSCGSNAVQKELANCSIMPLAQVTYTSSSPGCWVSPWQPCGLPAAD